MFAPTLNDVVDRVFVINLDSRPERLAAIREQFAKHAITNWERVPGVVFEDIPPNHGVCFKTDRKYILGSLGCAAAHKECFRRALDRSYARICVFQDDVVLADDFGPRLLQFFDEIGRMPWNIAYLGLSGRTGEAETGAVPVNNHAFGTFAYVVQDMGWVFRHIVLNIDYQNQEYDLVLNNLILKHHLRAVLARPPLVIHDAFTESSIH